MCRTEAVCTLVGMSLQKWAEASPEEVHNLSLRLKCGGGEIDVGAAAAVLVYDDFWAYALAASAAVFGTGPYLILALGGFPSEDDPPRRVFPTLRNGLSLILELSRIF